MRDSYRFERHEGRSIFRRIQSSKGGLIKEVWYISTSVKRGVDEARMEGEEGRSTRDIDVDVGWTTLRIPALRRSSVRESAVVVCSCKNWEKDRQTKGMNLELFRPLNVRYDSSSASWVRITSGFPSLMGCLSCHPNTFVARRKAA